MFLQLFTSFALCKNYAMLYAGSADYFNYRHQADIFTIYTQLLERGFEKSQILLCAYDDIARSESNPFKGQIFHSLDHKINVYPGTDAINVKGGSVNSRIFYNSIINLPTTSSDNVLIYYDNHGGPNLLGTPIGELISAHNLLTSFKKAAAKNLFKKVLFIIEACYSGSVGKVINLTDVAVITAATAAESSYAVVYDEEVGSYLTNEFTNFFCSLIDESPDITVGELYNTIKGQMEKSHACFFGDESVLSLPISDFIGKPNNIILHHNKNRETFHPAKPKDATQRTLDFFSTHSKAYIRAKARLEQIRLKALTEKLEAALELLVKYVDPENYEKIMNDTQSEATETYYSIVPIFARQFGEINPDDYGRFNVLKALAARHTKAEIVQGIFAVIY